MQCIYMKDHVVAIDIGTSACKVALYNHESRLVSSYSEEYPVYYPETGYAEQNPDEWWDAVCLAVKRLFDISGIESDRVAAVGVDGQSWSAIPVSRDGRILYNTPIWMDTRSSEICDEIISRYGNERFFALSRNSFKPSYSTPKVLWFKKEHPQVYENTYKFLQSNSYIVYKLTDRFTQDKSQGYGYHFFDMSRGCWDGNTADLLEIDLRKLPEIFDCACIVGEVTGKASGATGLAKGTPVVAGGLDACCGALGAGVYEPGQTQEQGGQAGGMSICSESPFSTEALIMSFHVVPGLWLLQGGTVAGGASIKWLKELIYSMKPGAVKNDSEAFMQMTDAAADIAAGSGGLIFLPYLAGERSPIWDSAAQGVFFGLSLDKGPAHLVRSVFEGTAFALMHNIETAKSCGAEISRMNAMGGAANSRIWTQIKCDVTGIPIDVPDSDTATTLGTAILAGVGSGLYSDFESAVSNAVKIKSSYEPDREMNSLYMRYYKIYIDLYRKLKGIMAEIDGINRKRFK